MKLTESPPLRGLMVSLGSAVLIVTTLVACTSEGEGDMNQDLTVDQAKAETQALEISVADALPAGEVLSTEQKPDGVLLSCSETTYQWTGRTTFQLDGTRDRGDVLRDVGADFSDTNGFSAELREGSTTPLMVVSGPDGLSFVADVDDSAVLTVSSASRCFELREDETSFYTY